MPTHYGFDEEVLVKAHLIIQEFRFRRELAEPQCGAAELPATVAANTGVVDDGWMTTKEAAKYTKVSTRTILLWARSGRLKGRQVGRNWKFKKSACDRAMKEG